MAAVVIRKARAGDSQFILSLVGRLAECDLPTWRTSQEVEAGTRRWIEHALNSPSDSASILIAEEPDGGAPLGFIFVHEEQDFFTGESVGHVSEIAVANDAEGTGAGTLLMNAAEDWAREKGYPIISLNVFAGNDRARRMYERLGYAPETVKYTKVLKGITQ